MPIHPKICAWPCAWIQAVENGASMSSADWKKVPHAEKSPGQNHEKKPGDRISHHQALGALFATFVQDGRLPVL